MFSEYATQNIAPRGVWNHAALIQLSQAESIIGVIHGSIDGFDLIWCDNLAYTSAR
jgi:hypothetical protein